MSQSGSRSESRFGARRVFFFALLASVPAFVASFAGCDDENFLVRVRDASSDVELDVDNDGSVTGDGGVDGSATLVRGKYLVDNILVCGDCHTPRTVTGAPDMTKYLAGVECFVDVNGSADAGGCLHTRNLTSDVTGLKSYTDDQIKTMFLDGKTVDGRNLFPLMPYWVFHNLRPDDANAIVTYLRTVPAIPHAVPPSDAPFNPVPAAAQPIDLATIPIADGGTATDNGRYLASISCIDCHTPELSPSPPPARPVDMTKPFAGGRVFPLGPITTHSVNLTPDGTGLIGWTAQDVVRALKQGRGRDDAGVCPPMPSGPLGAFGGMTNEDALDIANYIVRLPPINNDTGPDNACP